jgi:hypothetical protein
MTLELDYERMVDTARRLATQNRLSFDVGTGLRQVSEVLLGAVAAESLRRARELDELVRTAPTHLLERVMLLAGQEMIRRESEEAARFAAIREVDQQFDKSEEP